MKYSFAELAQNRFSKKFGGTTIGVADPYLSGYHFIHFDKLPASLPNYTDGEASGNLQISDIQNILSASCLGVTPPGGTLNKVEFTGLGGVKWSVPGNIDYGNTVSIKFLEMNKLPILSIMHSWVKMIRDYRTGVSDILEDGTTGEGYTKKEYSALMYYWTTAPDGNTVEYYACYDGMFPGKDPQDLFTSDVETVGKLDIEIEFNVDTSWHEPWVKEKCQSFSDSIFSGDKSTIGAYGQIQAG